MISEWTNQWKIKLNKTKSAQINFNSIKYLGITMDKRLIQKEHTTNKRKQCILHLHLLRQ